MATVFNEWVGREIPVSLARAIKRFNVSPSDLDMLLMGCYMDDLQAQAYIEMHSSNGIYRPPWPVGSDI